MTLKVPEGHGCERPGCSKPAPRGETCSTACRSAKWKLDNNYRDPRSVRRRGAPKPRRVRYAIVHVAGAVIEVLGYDIAPSRKAIERAFGIGDREDLEVVPASHLPALS
jgi:hypothetical protein